MELMMMVLGKTSFTSKKNGKKMFGYDLALPQNNKYTTVTVFSSKDIDVKVGEMSNFQFSVVAWDNKLHLCLK